MLRIDFYLQHLVRHNASGILLRSGRPVTFQFPKGDRTSSTPIEHAQIAQLVTEVASPTQLAEIERSNGTSFTHDGPGVNVLVSTEVKGAEDWIVRLVPTADRASADAGTEGLPTAMAADRTNFERPIGGEMAGGPAAPARIPHAIISEAQTPPLERPVRRRVESRRSIPPPKVQTVPGEPAINRWLREMVRLGASDLHLSSKVEPMVRLHGEMQMLEQRKPLEPAELEFEEIWDTDFAHEIEGVSRFRVNYFRDHKGIGAVFRQIPFEIMSVKELGISEAVLDLCWLSKGLVLVTGPTGSGKSTTLATLVDFINDNRSDHIITIEDPIEFVHANKKCLVNQREVGTNTKSFKNALRAALREDPDIVLVGEMRDLETIAIAIETAETGHLVFGTLHTTSAKSTVDRIIDQFPADRQDQIRVMLSESLRGVVAQVLCKKKGGGRVVAYEVLISNSAVSNLIREGKTYQITSVMQTGRKLGMQTLNDHLLEHVKAGRVEAEEAYIRSNDKMAMREAFERAGIRLDL